MNSQLLTSTARVVSSILKTTQSSFCSRSRLLVKLVIPNLCCDTLSPFSSFSWISPLYSSWSGLMQRRGRTTTPLNVPSRTFGWTMVPASEFVKMCHLMRTF